jgi:hypothetical protein
VRRARRSVIRILAIGLCLLGALAGPAQAATPLVELVQRFVPEHPQLDAAHDELVRVTAAEGEGSAAARAAGRAYAREGRLYADRVSALPATTTNQRTLRDAIADTDRELAADFLDYARGRIDLAEVDRRTAEGRARAAAELRPLVTAVAAEEGIDDSVDPQALGEATAPILLLVVGVVALGLLGRRSHRARAGRSAAVGRHRAHPGDRRPAPHGRGEDGGRGARGADELQP